MGAVRLSLAAGGSQHAGGAVPAQAKVVVAVGCRKATGAGARGRGQAGFARKAASSETSSECVPALQPHPSPLCHNTLRGGATPRLSAAPRAQPHPRLGACISARASPRHTYTCTHPPPPPARRPLASLLVAAGLPGRRKVTRREAGGVGAGRRRGRAPGRAGERDTHSPLGSARRPPGARGTRT
jgi:hypothetical protein